ncbi:hydroxylase [Halarchaeum grantii]|uniref:Hydroxylase n=1 Tax=Halarchaeum grantii TaxID=1193105 RepID=A0A830F6T6_9EURY|nr:FAD-dependent monooxygenase [Halarchaeum grantii]GGL24897.1 hydroxylase [Halarchaeum grantii]
MTLASIERYDPERVATVGERAVVAGGSVAGLCAARVLADAFEDVVVFERDALSEGPAARDGAPQTHHPHALLEAGRATLADVFPGFGEDLLSAGGLLIDSGSDMTWYDRGGTLAGTDARLPTYCASRPLFEHVVRERVRAVENVTLRGGHRVLDYDHADGRVSGVAVRDDAGETRHVEASLVVDATGRASHTPDWLAEHGYPAPESEEVTVDVVYGSTRIDRPADDRRMLLCAPQPERPRGAALIPIEDGQWEVIFQGVHGEPVPTERDAFVEWAASIPVDDIGRLVRERPWTADGVRRYPFPANVRRRYDALDRFPEGLVVTGDAIASFNPIYGQGMSVAALDALCLHHELAAGLEGIGPRVFERASDIVEATWRLAVGNDFTFAETTGPKPLGTNALNAYVGRLVERAQTDPFLSETFLRVYRLERPATDLFRPRVLWRALRP